MYNPTGWVKSLLSGWVIRPIGVGIPTYCLKPLCLNVYSMALISVLKLAILLNKTIMVK